MLKVLADKQGVVLPQSVLGDGGGSHDCPLHTVRRIGVLNKSTLN